MTRGVPEVAGNDEGSVTAGGAPGSPASGEALCDQLTAVLQGCIECGLCVEECLFLRRHGTPKAIADCYDPSLKTSQRIPFECSLCSLCTAVCPVRIDPASMFLEMRREAVRSGSGKYRQHDPILGYERRGTSRRYTCHCLPAGCDTVFFPGCALSGTRPETVTEVYGLLKVRIPALGIVLDCCANPSHDLGRQGCFDAVFGEMRDFLIGSGVRTVLVSCPNCHKVFRKYGRDLSVSTVYEVMARERPGEPSPVAGTVTIHDPCAVRFEAGIHAAVRDLVTMKGVTVQEMPHWGENTICCGEGGAVGLLSPDFAGRWKSERTCEAGETRIVTYCAGCVSVLGPQASHVLDLVFEPEAAMAGRIKPARPPLTYWNRLRLKNSLRKNAEDGRVTERPFSAAKPGRSGLARVFHMLGMRG